MYNYSVSSEVMFEIDMPIPIRKKIRLQHVDYSHPGYYFITICSKDRANLFGNQVGAGLVSAQSDVSKIVELSKIGQIIKKQWQDIPNQFENVGIDEFVIMPNHIHGILILNNPGKRAGARPAPTVSDIICSFKSKCSVHYLKYIKKNNLKVSGEIWQQSFYEHIIRKEESLDEIREYIAFNPLNWHKDRNNLQ